jgi:hypothetical protein
LLSEGSRWPGREVIDGMDSAIASTARRAWSAIVPDKIGRQELSAHASTSFAIEPLPFG